MPKPILILLALLVCGHSFAAIALVQRSSTRCASSTTCTVTLSGVASDDTLIIFPAGGAVSFSSLVDNNGTVTQVRGYSTPATVGMALYYEANAASGAHKITLTMGSSSNLELYAAEYSGMASSPLDTSTTIASGDNANPVTASITPAGNNELLVGFVNMAGASVAFGWNTSSLSQVDTQAGGPSSAWATAVQTTGTAGSASAAASASGHWLAVAAFFKASAAGYFSLSHSMQMSPMTILFPLSSASPNAAQNWAYFDGTTGFYPPQRVVVGNGRWPFVYTLISGPPGMTIGATTYNYLWNGLPETQWAAGYGVVKWTPTAAALNNCVTGNGWVWTGGCSGTGVYSAGITVQVCDQNNQGGTSSCVDASWPITVSESHFIFVNADPPGSPLNPPGGVDQSICGTISSPCNSIGYVEGEDGGPAMPDARGSTLVLRGANAMYWISPTTASGTNFVPNGATGSASYVGMPGDSGNAVLDMTGQHAGSVPSASTLGSLITLGAGNLTFENLHLYGYPGFSPTTLTYNGTGELGPLGVSNFRPFVWGTANRLTFQGITWDYAGYGASATNNASMFYPTGGSSPTQVSNNITITGCFENNRQTGNNDNNAGLILAYGLQNSAIEMTEVYTTNNIGNAYYIKIDDGTITVRDNYAYAGGGGNSAYEIYGPIYYGTNNVEVSYNISVNFLNTNIGENGIQNFGQVDYFRNSFITTANGWQIGSPNANLTAPYTWYNISAGGGSLYGTFISAPTYASGGALTGTVDYAITTLGANYTGPRSGESSVSTGNAGNAFMPINGFSIGNGTVTLNWWGAVPGNNGDNLYRDTTGTSLTSFTGSASGTSLTVSGTPTYGIVEAGDVLSWGGSTPCNACTTVQGGSGTSWTISPAPPSAVSSIPMKGYNLSGFTQYHTLAANTPSFTDNGSNTGWLSSSGAPATNTALSNYNFLINSNLMQTPTQTTLPTGPTITPDGPPYNQFAVSGMLDPTTGLETSAWKSVNPTLVCLEGAETGC